MSITTPAPVVIDPVVDAAVTQADEIISTPEVQAIVAEVAPKIPAKVRSVLYEVAKWAGLLGAGASAAAGILHGNSALYVGTAGFILLSATSLLAKAHITA